MKTSRGFWAALIVVVAILQVFGLPLAMAAPRGPLPPLPDLAQALCKERFDEPCRAGYSNAQVSISDYTFVESWSGYALQRSGRSLTPFVLPAVRVAGHTNLACDAGALSFWFRPYWSSASLVNGAGPGVNARLMEFVAFGNDEAAVVWSLQSSADGSTLSLMSPDKTGGKALLQTKIAWPAGEWRLLTLNYGPSGTELFIDGELVAAGAGTVAVPPSVAALVLGSTLAGTELAEGEFEEFYAFDRTRNEAEVAAYYNKRKARAALGPITADEEQAIAEGWWVDPLTPDDAEQEDGGQFPFGAAAYGCGLWLEITASNALATLTLHNTRSGAGYQILTNSDLTTTNWSLFLTNVADGTGYLTWTNISINWYHYPSLAVNCPGDMVTGFAGSSTTNYIGAFYTARLADGTVFNPPRTIQLGSIGHSGQWGDYSATMADPVDLWSFWTIQAYSAPFGAGAQRWRTVIAEIRARP